MLPDVFAAMSERMTSTFNYCLFFALISRPWMSYSVFSSKKSPLTVWTPGIGRKCSISTAMIVSRPKWEPKSILSISKESNTSGLGLVLFPFYFNFGSLTRDRVESLQRDSETSEIGTFSSATPAVDKREIWGTVGLPSKLPGKQLDSSLQGRSQDQQQHSHP